jgi:hypothetical protein
VQTSHHLPQLLTQIAESKLRVLRLPEAVDSARRAHAEAEFNARALRDQLAEIEAEVLVFVQAETKDDGKPAFSNDAARKAEVRRRRSEKPTYQQIARTLSAAEVQCRQLALDVERLEDEHRAIRIHADYTIAETQLLVAGR